MKLGAAALVLLQPVGPPALWSGAGIVDRLQSAMARRYKDVYFRPVVQAESLADLRWKVAKLRLRFAANTTAFGLGVFALKQAGFSRALRIEDHEEVYEYFQQRLSASRFSEETIANIDYAIYTSIRFANGFDPNHIDLSAEFTWRQIAKWLEVTNLFSLYIGAVTLAALEPSLIKNPLGLRELALSATKAADALVVAGGEFGITIA